MSDESAPSQTVIHPGATMGRLLRSRSLNNRFWARWAHIAHYDPIKDAPSTRKMHDETTVFLPNDGMISAIVTQACQIVTHCSECAACGDIKPGK